MLLKFFLGILFFALSTIYFYVLFLKIAKIINIICVKYIKQTFFVCSITISSVCLNYLSYPAIILYHFVFFSLILLCLYKIIKFIFKNTKIMQNVLFKLSCLVFIPLILTLSVIIYGYFNINTIQCTTYNIYSEKLTNNYKVLLLSDIHYGSVQNKSLLDKQIDVFNSYNLDFVVLDGDIVDEFTSKEQMQHVFNNLSKINTTFGIYFVYGNHDRQNKTVFKSFSEIELVEILNLNNITILSDENTLINNNIFLIGREDKQYNSSNRKDINYFITDTSKYIIVADHQPVEVENNAKRGVDLQLSGHTHSFQVWPIGSILSKFGVYTYGKYNINNFNLIVNSGFAGWGFQLRTERHCEYVIINLLSN